MGERGVNSIPARPESSQSRNQPIFCASELRAPAAPAIPVVAGELLSGDPIRFLDFLKSEKCTALCDLLFGEVTTSAGTMLGEFRKAVDFELFYCGKPGKLTDNIKTKTLIKKFAHRAYRGDPNGRGVDYWKRVAWLLWNTYAALMALRARAEKIKRQEINRIAGLADKRRARADYMRRYRADRRKRPVGVLGGATSNRGSSVA